MVKYGIRTTYMKGYVARQKDELSRERYLGFFRRGEKCGEVTIILMQCRTDFTAQDLYRIFQTYTTTFYIAKREVLLNL